MQEEPEWYRNGWHKTYVNKYSQAWTSYEALSKKLVEVLVYARERLGIWAIIQARTKTVASFAEKILRKYPKYKDPLQEVTDLAGVCVITLTQEDANRVGNYVENERGFEVDRRNSVDIRTRLRPNEFGYRAIHYIVSARSPVVLGVEIPSALRPLKAEIQIQTLLQYAWAKVGHDRIYKAQLEVPLGLERVVNGVAALLEQADNQFSRVVEALDTYRNEFESYLDATGLHHEIRKMEAVFNCDEADLKAAQTLAQLYMAAEQWPKALRILRQTAQGRGSESSNIWRDLGYAKCRLGQVISGQRALRKAISLNPNNMRAHCDLGHTYLDRKPREAFKHYRMAFEKHPQEPCAIAHYIEARICLTGNADFLDAMQGALEAAINESAKRVDMKVDLPNSNFNLGRFNLFLGKPCDSLYAYAKAVGFCTSPEHIDNEMRSIERMSSALRRGKPDGMEWVRRFLIVAAAAKAQANPDRGTESTHGSFPTTQEISELLQRPQNWQVHEEHLRQFARRPSKKNIFQEPVVIVAGGCDVRLEKELRQRYGRLMRTAFRHFEGTIICGGTRSGISGMVGDLPDPKGRIIKIGYLPPKKQMPTADQIHPAYLIRHVAGPGYTPLGPIQTWAELLLDGVDLKEVRILGINGGQLTAFEYRLGLALGAKVGLIETSGRAVSSLLPDFDWKRRTESLIPLPEDAATVAAFVNAGKSPSSKLSNQDCIIAGQSLHSDYRDQNLESKRRVHASMLPWDKLDKGYQQSNIQQAAYAERILRSAGYELRRIQAGKTPHPPEALMYGQWLRVMAQLEHGRYNAERLSSGWRLGEDVPEKKTNPCLVPWDDLTATIRRYDYEAVAKFPLLMARAGLEVVPASNHNHSKPGKLERGHQKAKLASASETSELDPKITASPVWVEFQQKMVERINQIVEEDKLTEQKLKSEAHHY